MKKRLIINADDFGLNDAATDAIAECYLNGTVTSTTMMVNSPGLARAADFAISNPGLGVGLHFNITWGRPVSKAEKVPSLVSQDGVFHSRDVLAKKLLLRQVPVKEIKAELEAQLDRFRQLGLEPSHIDSHQHVHAFNPVFSLVADTCRSLSIPIRVPWVSSEPDASLARRLRRLVLRWLLYKATRVWNKKLIWNNQLGSVFDVSSLGLPIRDDHYRYILSHFEGGVFELMVHPVTSSSAMDGFTGIGEISESEWAYLRQRKILTIARELDFELITYRDI